MNGLEGILSAKNTIVLQGITFCIEDELLLYPLYYSTQTIELVRLK